MHTHRRISYVHKPTDALQKYTNMNINLQIHTDRYRHQTHSQARCKWGQVPTPPSGPLFAVHAKGVRTWSFWQRRTCRRSWIEPVKTQQHEMRTRPLPWGRQRHACKFLLPHLKKQCAAWAWSCSVGKIKAWTWNATVSIKRRLTHLWERQPGTTVSRNKVHRKKHIGETHVSGIQCKGWWKRQRDREEKAAVSWQWRLYIVTIIFSANSSKVPHDEIFETCDLTKNMIN